MATITVTIPDDLKSDVEAITHKVGENMNQFVTDAVEREVRRRDKARVEAVLRERIETMDESLPYQPELFRKLTDELIQRHPGLAQYQDDHD